MMLSVKIYLVIGDDLINAQNFSAQSIILSLGLDIWRYCQTAWVYRPYLLVTNTVYRTHMLGLFKPKEGKMPELASWHKLYL